MTQDEFERIVVSLSQMGGFNLIGQGGYHVPLEGVLRIVHSNLHQEDREKYELKGNQVIRKPSL